MTANRPDTNLEIITNQQESPPEPDSTAPLTAKSVSTGQGTTDRFAPQGAEMEQNLQDQVQDTGDDHDPPEASVLTETTTSQTAMPTGREEAGSAREPSAIASEAQTAGSQALSTSETVKDEDREPESGQAEKNAESGKPDTKASSAGGALAPRPVVPLDPPKARSIETGSRHQGRMSDPTAPQKAGTTDTTVAQADQPAELENAVASQEPGAAESETQKRAGSQAMSTSEKVEETPFTLQAGAFLTQTYADEKMAELIAKGYDAYIFETIDNRQRRWFLVRFGHFENRKQAVRFLDQFKKREEMTAIIALSGTK